eukprot:CAMPEP_0198606652 /NCGR_PEP_ID=MMETSP1462-20131121/155003_1 /TAXON_ID=1333877 /ORGANISM="Brandtodinium nutriculum, Strain RCC3387" /LENGTH=190 /DNA_ID=CAMNT_0044338457 /DNA_START=73 /DNA_END=646 /DNA_ORIENTATION=-
MSAAVAFAPAEPTVGAAAPVVSYAAAPLASCAAVPAEYVVQQPVTYFTQPEVTYEVMPAEGQIAHEAAPVQYVHPAEYVVQQPVTYLTQPEATCETMPAVQYVQPAVYPISAERFAQIAAGIPLTQEEINAMIGIVPVAVEDASEAAANPAAVQSAVEPTPLVKSEKIEKSSSKKKSLKGIGSKKSKGCC